MITSVTPVHSLMERMFFQVLPPSMDLKSPRSPPGPQRGPCDATYTTSELRGSISTRAMCSDFFNPILRQVRPSSSERYTPSPQLTLRWLLFSPEPTHTTLGFFGSSA